MADRNGVNFKIFLLHNDVKDICRVVIDHSVVTSYIYLKEKLELTYPILRNHHYKIAWKDADGDEISIKNDNDLEIALMEISSDIKTLYVILQSEKYATVDSTAEEESSQQRSPVIICDVCDVVITGIRYKCLQCLDYDLCSTCAYQGHHTDHIMIRVPVTDVYLPKCARKFMHNIARNLKKSAHVASKEAYRAAKFANKLGHAAAKSAGTEHKQKHDAPGCSNQQEKKCDANDVPFKDLGAFVYDQVTPFLEMLRNVEPTTEINQDGGAVLDLIRNAVDGFFGRYQENEHGQGNSTDNSNNQNATAAPTPMDVETGCQEQSVPTPTSNAASIPVSVPTPAPAAAAVPIFVPTPAMISTETSPPASGLTSTPITIPILNTTTPQTDNTDRRDPGWTFVATPQIPTTSDTNTNTINPPQTNAPAFVYHENPKIAEALVQLHEMGFFNEGGALTRLLEIYNGDVSLVVKTLIEAKK